MNVRIVCACLAIPAILAGCISRPVGKTPVRSFAPQPVVVSAAPAAKAAPVVGRADGEAFPANPGLTDYLRVAGMNSAALESAFNRWKASMERIPQAGALPDPRFTYRYFIEEVETRVGPQRQSFGLTQMFPWFGKLTLAGDQAALAAEADRQRYRSAKLKLFHDVTAAYYEYYYLARATEVTRENLKLLKFVEDVARARFKTAVGGHPDVVRAQVELGKLDDRLRALTELRGPVVAGLNAALNRPHDAPLPEPSGAIPEPERFSDQTLFAKLPDHNPDWRALDAEVRRAGRNVKLARKAYYPDVTVGVDYIDVATSSGGRSPSDDGKDPVVAMVSLNLPVWRAKLDAGVREARRRKLSAAHARTQKANDLNAELKLALYRFRDAERKIDLYRDTLLPKARQSFKVTQAAYRTGKAGFSDVVDAQRVLLEFELSAQRALVDRARRLAKLEMLVGGEIGPPLPGGRI